MGGEKSQASVLGPLLAVEQLQGDCLRESARAGPAIVKLARYEPTRIQYYNSLLEQWVPKCASGSP